MNILLVEDHRSLLKALTLGLNEAGFEVFGAQNVADAMALIAHQRLDLAILDVELGGSSGLELAKWLNENTRIPFIFLSGHSDEALVSRAVDCGAVSYLVKPVEVEQLRPMIESAVKRGREIFQLRDAESQLSNALQASRNVSIAVGILMERVNIDQGQAFEKLRAHARSRQKKIDEVAQEIIEHLENLNAFCN